MRTSFIFPKNTAPARCFLGEAQEKNSFCQEDDAIIIVGDMRPKILLDIKSKGMHTYSDVPHRVNCLPGKQRVSLDTIKKFTVGLTIVFSAFYFAFGLVLAPNSNNSSFAQTSNEQQQRQLLEQELAELERQIAQDEAQLNAYRREGKTLTSEISSLDTKISKLNLQIRAVNLSLNQLDQEIKETEENISETEARLDRNKAAIGASLRGVYETEQISLITILLKNPNLSDFFSDINNFMEIQDRLTAVVRQVEEIREDLWTEKEVLSLQKQDTAALRISQDQQKKEVLSTKDEKKILLAATQGEEDKYQEIVQIKKKTAAEIRSRIFRFLGGGEMSFAEAYEIAKFAGQATAIEPSFILAILDRESGFGRNVGKCTYHKSMAPGPPESRRDDVTPFLRIVNALGLDPETTLVSCANSDGYYGGAMGPTQFIPTTWVMYEADVAEIVGVETPSPWNNAHAITATSLYLKDALQGCTQYEDKNTQIRCAAARYYAGGNYKRHMWTSYGSGTLSRKLQFDDDIKILEGN